MQRFTDESSALAYIFSTYDRVPVKDRALDEIARDITPTRRLLTTTGLEDAVRECAVVTGSKGKGSVAALTAQLLQSLGHRTGLLTSPHLRFWPERIRVDGQAIPQADFLRILSELAPAIDAEATLLNPDQYISPQGIFLLMALKWFEEQGVEAAVFEVGRGGRYDDVSLVPHKVALFTPIMIEHAQYLGATVDRIAWHKSGIISDGSFVYSLPQAPEVLEIIQREADVKGAEFFWFSQLDLGQFVADTPTGVRMTLQRYGEIDLPFYAPYMIDNATLAVQAAGNMHGRLKGIPHGSPEYVDAIRRGLEGAIWFGRAQKLQDNPPVYIDGSVTPTAVQAFLSGIRKRALSPVVIVAGVPDDRDYDAVYRVMAQYADRLILTQTTRTSRITYPPAEQAIATARQYLSYVEHTDDLASAVALAKKQASTTGTVLLCVSQPLVADAMNLWDVPTANLARFE